MKSIAVFAVVATVATAAFNAVAAYDVKPSGIRPAWSGAEPGVWTQDYAAATNAAAQSGRPVIVMTSGMWWCPHCQALERKVLSQKAWSDMVSELGAYLVVLDFPYRGTVSDAESHKTADFDVRTQRPGWGFQCWLYDADYRAEYGLADTDVFKLIEERNYAWQSSLGLSTAQTVTIGNWNATGTITYRRVGYPSLLILGPDGHVRGRPPCNVTADAWTVESACEYVTGNVRTVLQSDGSDEADDLAATSPFLEDPPCAGELVALEGQTLSSVDKADWRRIEIPGAYGEKWTFSVSPRDGYAAANLTLAVSSDSAGKTVLASVDAAASEGSVSVVFPAAGKYYIKVSPAKALSEVAGYVFSYGYDEVVVPASFTTTSVTFANNAAEAVLTVRLGTTDTNYVAEVDWQTADVTASNGVDFACSGGTLRWDVGETRDAKTISIPIQAPASQAWQANKSFRVDLYPKSHCSIPELMSSCTVTLTASVARNPGKVSFAEEWATAKPICREGDELTINVLRTDGFEGDVSAQVSLSMGKASYSRTLEWEHNDRSAKSFTWTVPETEGMQDDIEGAFVLAASGGAELGSPNKAQFILRDKLAVSSFDEYNASAFGGAASVSGDSWFYGRESADSEDPVFRSRSLTAAGTVLSIAVTGPSVLDLSVEAKGGASAVLSLGGTVLAQDFSGRHLVAVPSGSQTVKISGTRGGEPDSYLVADWTVSSLSPLRLHPVAPSDCAWVRVAGGLSLSARLDDGCVLPADAALKVATYAGTSASSLSLLDMSGEALLGADGFTYPEEGDAVADAALTGFATGAMGSYAWWRMDTVFSDEYGNSAVREGEVAVMKLLSPDAPGISEEGGLPDGWSDSGSGMLVAPELVVGVKAQVGSLSFDNVEAGDSVSVSLRSGTVPEGVVVTADAKGVSFAGVPVRAGDTVAEFQAVVTKSSGEVVRGATFTVAFSAVPASAPAGLYTGYRIVRSGDGVAQGAGAGGAEIEVGPTGAASGWFEKNGRRYAFSTGSFDSHGDGKMSVAAMLAKAGTATDEASMTLFSDSEEHDATIVAGDAEYWLYRDNWRTAEGRRLLAEVVGEYSAALPVVGSEPAGNAPEGSGYLCATVRCDGTVAYSGIDSLGRHFSGLSPAYYVFDCCTGSGKKWFFYVDVRPSGCMDPMSRLSGLVSITPDSSDPSVRYLSSGEAVPLRLVDMECAGAYSSCWTNSLGVVGGTFDIPSGMDAAKAQELFKSNRWQGDVVSYARNSGVFSVSLPGGLSARGVHVVHSAGGKPFWSGLYFDLEKKTRTIIWESK